MAAKDRCQIIVRHYECDPLGHVNHAVYLHYFEVGRLAAMAAVGLPFRDVIERGYTVVATDVFVHYRLPALSEDVLEVQSWITRFQGACMFWQQEVYRQRDGEVLTLADVTGAFTRLDGRPIRIPAAMQTLLEAVYVPEAARHAARSRRRADETC